MDNSQEMLSNKRKIQKVKWQPYISVLHIWAHTPAHTDMHTYKEYESIHGNDKSPIQNRSYLCQAWGSS